MYVSDQKVTKGLAIFALLAGPWFGVAKGSGGWLLEVALLIATLSVGRSIGFKWMTLCLSIGYGIAFLLGGGLSSVINIGFLPWVSVLTIWGVEHVWSRKSNLFWSLVLAGVLGVLPVIPMILQGMGTELMQEISRSMMDQYRQSGMLTSFTQQGISEADIENYVQQFLQYLFLFIPALAALGSMMEYGAVYYFFARWFPQKDQPFPLFSSFRLPWFAIWGVNLGIVSYLVGDQWNLLSIRTFGLNVMLIYAGVAFVLGSAIFIYYLRSPRLSGFIKWILIFMGFVYFQVTIMGLILLGLFDLVLNFRRIPEDNSN
ncbi:DUF2232 domain-containing protein [Desulfitobacterium metallireducens]|uniref:DUF2232 domain-containing protein n=1 Tax=Desulfitobacterium metallireducens DSM 15288 TaxID=871968 RepID=W0EBT3_9FIRM|nr:hypothetical protein DESME_15765 [Desulfitobacterium metallireducens DSM 15288]